MKIRGVVFDLDATLVNLGEYVEWNTAKDEAKKAYITHGCDPAEIQRCDHGGLHDFLNEMNTYIDSSPLAAKSQKINEAAYRKIHDYEMKGVERSTPLPGVVEALKWLHSRGVKMSVCTTNSTEVAECILRNTGLLPYFTHIAGRTPHMRLKPYPDPVHACLAAMGVKPREAVMVGDSHKDVEAGKAAGTWTIAVPVRFTRMSELEKNKPDAIIWSLAELPEALRHLEESKV